MSLPKPPVRLSARLTIAAAVSSALNVSSPDVPENAAPVSIPAVSDQVNGVYNFMILFGKLNIFIVIFGNSSLFL